MNPSLLAPLALHAFPCISAMLNNARDQKEGHDIFQIRANHKIGNELIVVIQKAHS